MVSIVDLSFLEKEVVINGKTVATVRGITAEEIAHLIATIPELRLVFADKNLGPDVVQSLVKLGPDIMAEIICMAVDGKDDKKLRAQMKKLPAGAAAVFIQTIAEVTFPQGLLNFIDGLSGVLASVVPAAAGGPTKAAAGKSPEPSSSASATDTQSKSLGDTHQDNSQDGERSLAEAS